MQGRGQLCPLENKQRTLAPFLGDYDPVYGHREMTERNRADF